MQVVVRVQNRPQRRSRACPPPHYAKSHKERAGQLKRAPCHYRISHKSARRIPHDAAACRFFEQSDNPPPIHKDPLA
ncbi:hypothetical protein AQZ49_01775 [Novosphingobium sp. FSW06-99]|nr:hypothetical protein AQZ49_01775 [Novosphingobium sp. FSW06-99]